MHRVPLRSLALVLVLGMVAVACGGGSSKSAKSSSGSSASSGSGTTAATKLPPCPLDALKKASGPVEIVMWHSMKRGLETELTKLADEFNASQSKVKVKLVNQVTYDDTLTKFKAGMQTGDLPDAVQMSDLDVAFAIDSKAMLPAQSCVNADHYDLSGHLPRVKAYFTKNGVLWPMPFNTSNPVLYYDKHDFTTAGLDPAKPPTTLDEVLADARKLKAAGIKAPLDLTIDPWYLVQMLEKANQLVVNESNGRVGRPTKLLLGNKVGDKIFEWYATLAKEGLVKTAKKDSFEELLSIGNGDSSMAIQTSAAMGTAEDVLFSGGQADKQLEFGVAPLPAPPGNGGSAVAGGEIFIVAKSSPEKQAATWEWLKFLNTAKSQAQWAAGTGYIPNVKAALDEPVLQEKYTKQPEFKVPYDQLASGPSTPATAGPLMGPNAEVFKKIADQMQAVLEQGAAPLPAAAKARSDGDAVLADYNSRIGG